MAGNTVRIRAVLDDKVSSGLDRIRDRFDRLGKNKGAASILQGVGVGLGVSAYGLLDRAISGVIGTIGDATKAAMEDERSQARLGAALSANIPAWDGNSNAIERVLESRMRLGFSDDEQRDSLARIVVATKDSTKALQVQRAAMDLARLKGIDLASASDALIKVEGGQFRALKALGIQLPKNATATEALAAVEKAASGQAEAYAKTNTGKLLASQVKVGEAMEKFGEKTMPLVAEGAEAGADAVETLSDAFEMLDDATESIGGLGEVWGGLLSGLTLGASGTYELVRAQQDAAESAREAALEADALARSERTVGGTMDYVADESDDMADKIVVNTEDSATAFEKMGDAFRTTASDLIDKAYDPLLAHDQLLTDQTQINAAKRVLASKTATTAEKREARETLNSVSKDAAEQLVVLAEAGQTASGAYKQGIADLKEQIRTATGPTKQYLQGVLDLLERIDAMDSIRIRVNISGNVGVSGARARGGPVEADKAYIVGEEGPELFVPNSGGSIIPNGGPGAMAGGGVSEVHTHIYLDGRQIAESVDRHSFLGLQRAPVTAGRV